jgi:adenosylhomocysteinase
LAFPSTAPTSRSSTVTDSEIADPGLAVDGDVRIRYAERAMPLMAGLMQRFAVQRPFDGLAIAACLHVTAETAMMARLLRAGGAAVSLAASNPLSTQDDIAAALAERYGISVFARAGVDRRGYYRHIEAALADPKNGPDLVIDDGGDLVNTLHTRAAALLPMVKGGCESTSTGVIRLRRMAAEGALAFPVVAANDTAARRLVEGTCGTGQSAIDGILRATNTLLAGKTVVVAGFGASGRGIAERARGLGAQVIVTEIDPVRALDASLRGFRVLPMAQAAPIGEVFVTATGSCDVIGAEHFAAMRDGAILANAGHFDVEIDLRALAGLARAVHTGVRQHVDAYELGDGRTVLLLADGRVVNLVAAEGHPPEVMDVAFGIEALALAWLARAVSSDTGDKLPVGVHDVPADIDAEAARLVLAATGTTIDALTPVQQAYLESWRLGSLFWRVVILAGRYLAGAGTLCSLAAAATGRAGLSADRSAGSAGSTGRVSRSHPTSPSGYTKYPHRVAGASVNMTASPRASRQAEALASAGGRIMIHRAKPIPAATSSPTAAQCPAIPVSASRCPGSGLAAGVLCLVRPSGNSTVFCRNEYGLVSAAGAIATASNTASPTAVTRKRQAFFAPSRAPSIAVKTGTAGHAVAFMAHATPRAAAARIRPDGRAISANETNISAITGGSVIPSASGNAIIGEAAMKTVDSRTPCRQSSQCRCGAAILNAPQIKAMDTAVSHTRGSANKPLAPSAFGIPNTAMTGRYGL